MLAIKAGGVLMGLHLHYRPKKRGKKSDKADVYYSLATSYRNENGDPRKIIIQDLGVLTEEEVQVWQFKLQILREKTIDDICRVSSLQIEQQKAYLDVAVLSAIYDKLGLNDIFKCAPSQSPLKILNTQAIAKILVMSRCLDPQANTRTVDWFRNSCLPDLMGIDDPEKYNRSKIFRELSAIHKRKPLLEKLFLSQSHNRFALEAEENKLNTRKKSVELFFFDGTTTYFEGSECPLGMPGKDKTHGYQNSTMLICLLTDRKGYPIAWEVSEGNKRDVSEFKKIGNRLANNLNISNITYCFDRGVASSSNFDLIEDTLKSKFITGIDKDQIAKIFNLQKFIENTRDSLIKDNEANKENIKEIGVNKKRIVTIDGFYRVSPSRYGKELGINDDSRRYIISFDINIYNKDRETREKAIECVLKEIEEINNELAQAKKDRDEDISEEKIKKLISKNKLQGIIEYEITPCAIKNLKDAVQSYFIKTKVNEHVKTEKGLVDGILIYITNHTESSDGFFDLPASTIVRHYRDKYVIENAFRHLKSFLDLRPIFVYIENHVLAHIDICMASYSVNQYIKETLDKIGVGLREFYGLIKKYSNISEISLNSSSSKIIRLPKLPSRLISMLSALGVEHVTSDTHLSKLKFKS